MCESDDVDGFGRCIRGVLNSDLRGMGEKGIEHLKDNYTAQQSYEIIMEHCGE